MCSPATPAPVERVFSGNDVIMQPIMSDALFKMLVMLKYCWHYNVDRHGSVLLAEQGNWL